jgi:hypothetical protein
MQHLLEELPLKSTKSKHNNLYEADSTCSFYISDKVAYVILNGNKQNVMTTRNYIQDKWWLDLAVNYRIKQFK